MMMNATSSFILILLGLSIGFCTHPSHGNYSVMEPIVTQDARDVINAISDHLDRVLAHLRATAEVTRSNIVRSRRKKNAYKHRYAGAIVVGGLLQQYADNLIDAEITTWDVLDRVGRSFYSALQAGNKLLSYKNETLECGLPELEQVIQQYGMLFNLADVYDPILSGKFEILDLPSDLRPENLEYHVIYFGIETRRALACILEERVLSKSLELAISATVDSLHRNILEYEKIFNSIKRGPNLTNVNSRNLFCNGD